MILRYFMVIFIYLFGEVAFERLLYVWPRSLVERLVLSTPLVGEESLPLRMIERAGDY